MIQQWSFQPAREREGGGQLWSLRRKRRALACPLQSFSQRKVANSEWTEILWSLTLLGTNCLSTFSLPEAFKQSTDPRREEGQDATFSTFTITACFVLHKMILFSMLLYSNFNKFSFTGTCDVTYSLNDQISHQGKSTSSPCHLACVQGDICSYLRIKNLILNHTFRRVHSSWRQMYISGKHESASIEKIHYHQN